MNIALKAYEILDKLENEGFNEIHIYSIEKESVWHEQYAIFTLEFKTFDYFDSGDDLGDNPYIIPQSFDEDKLRNDFLTYLGTQFPKCKINISYEGKEFEICGPKYKSFFRKYADKLEYLSDLGGHHLFIHDARPANAKN